MARGAYRTLFLCTRNCGPQPDGRMRAPRRGGDRFRAFSAGSHPKGAPHPMTLEPLRRLRYDVLGTLGGVQPEHLVPRQNLISTPTCGRETRSG